MVDKVSIQEWCVSGTLPDEESFFKAVLEDDCTFTDIEGQHWDFKDQWPFSYSDAYFGGIARLICAYSNASGGIIVFGVKDDTREGGRNRVRPNIDKLHLSFEQLTGSRFHCDFRSYIGKNRSGAVDVLLIQPRDRQLRPFSFKRKIGPYEEGVIWVRSGNEVVRAEPQHYGEIFLSDQTEGVEGSIPPSTAQIRKFIGRVEAMTELFYWMQNSDEPRTYLYGKGGSGKTTIAREFARLVKASGGALRVEGEDTVDLVIFLSAKERELVSVDAEIVTINEPDFYDESSLLRQIVHYSGGELDCSSTGNDNLVELRKTLTEYFDLFSYLIVVDDIDTLTTKGIDPGADFLYRALSRAKKRSKILYTIRNAPSQSIHNSIEVPGLHGSDYRKFVDECVARFKTSLPDNDFLENRLPKLSERRPLVIESIIALSRTAGGFAGAERLFTQNIGDNVRDYVFSREWDALPNGLERPLLAALADLRRATTFEDLKIILQAGDSTVRDAIGGVREMFLSVDDAGDQTLFSLAPLTRSFVNSKKDSIKIYPAVKVRVQNFKRSIKITSPEVARLIARVRAVVPLRFTSHSVDNLRAALDMVRTTGLKENVTEDPVFRALRGYVEAIQARPDMAAVRDSFLFSIQMKHEPEIEELMAWFKAEKGSGTLEEHFYKIVDTVISGRRYSEDEKIGMISRKATTSYNFARHKIHSDPESAMRGFRQSVLLHLRAFKQNALTGSPMLSISEGYARNTFDQWLRMLSQVGRWEPINALLPLEEECEGYLDPVYSPFSSYLHRLEREALFGSERARVNNAARKILSQGLDVGKWMDTTIVPDIKKSLSSVIERTNK